MVLLTAKWPKPSTYESLWRKGASTGNLLALGSQTLPIIANQNKL
jgi:hypothetical protein